MKDRNVDFRTARRTRRGGVMVFSLIAVIAIGAMSVAALQVSIATTKRQGASVDQRQAFYLAEAGLAEAFAGLGIGKTGQVGTQADPAGYGGGLFWVDAVDPGGSPAAAAAGVDRGGSGPRCRRHPGSAVRGGFFFGAAGAPTLEVAEGSGQGVTPGQATAGDSFSTSSPSVEADRGGQRRPAVGLGSRLDPSFVAFVQGRRGSEACAELIYMTRP
jgi:hypothetical protein